MKTINIIITIVLVVLVVIGAYFVFNSSSSNSIPSNLDSNNSGSMNSVGSSKTVTIQNFAFSPSDLIVRVGDTVIWTNLDSAPHTVTSDSGNELDSATLSKGQTYSHTFTTAGTFSYHCVIHPMMKAKIIVE